MPVPPRDPKGHRTGYTTGLRRRGGQGGGAFSLGGRRAQDEATGQSATCSILKDAGDDPDCTHGAESVAEVELREAPGIEIRGGPGVATVTKPGLRLAVGTAAINPIPSPLIGITTLVCRKVAERCTRHAGGGLEVWTCLVDFGGGLLGCYPEAVL